MTYKTDNKEIRELDDLLIGRKEYETVGLEVSFLNQALGQLEAQARQEERERCIRVIEDLFGESYLWTPARFIIKKLRELK
jgi:hypothetical protein